MSITNRVSRCNAVTMCHGNIVTDPIWRDVENAHFIAAYTAIIDLQSQCINVYRYIKNNVYSAAAPVPPLAPWNRMLE